MQTINNIIIEGLGCENLKYTVLHGLTENSTILNIKDIIFSRFNIPKDIYYFIYKSHHIDDDKTLSAIEFSVVLLMLLTLFIISQFPNYFSQNDRYRFYGDLIYVYPLAVMPFL